MPITKIQLHIDHYGLFGDDEKDKRWLKRMKNELVNSFMNEYDKAVCLGIACRMALYAIAIERDAFNNCIIFLKEGKKDKYGWLEE